ncbi:hypothetical protein N9C84_01640 [Desulfobacterales bacterium]|nr:hypothetical protein [Desulfobacterales bacterium]
MWYVSGTAGGAIPACFGVAFMTNGLKSDVVNPYAMDDGFAVFDHAIRFFVRGLKKSFYQWVKRNGIDQR